MTRQLRGIPLSVLDLVNVLEGEGAQEAFQHMVKLAQYTEQLGYHRYWLTEHHNNPRVVSSATPILIKHVLEHTDSMRVGSGGVMLPNHSPLTVAEQFGTLATLYPNRIDLGLGRAPGTDRATAIALRRTVEERAETFADDLMELQQYLQPLEKQSSVRAYPGVGTEIPIYVLGSSLWSAHLAAELGLPYAFAAHFAPTYLTQAMQTYRSEFRPSKFLSSPYAMVCVNVVAAESDEEARFLFTTTEQLFLQIIQGREGLTPRPVTSVEDQWTAFEKQSVKSMAYYTIKGSPRTVQSQLKYLASEVEFDELIAVSHIYDQQARRQSYRLFYETVRQMD
ncbi:luciferase family oxidoreductase, group 1 [Seinonella peptonophila]|uniref:Luciferase family oxidoreductase, group 1 n=1 Tax=Seinonella peptonophila TaxID=112248 RepID=A0A1M4XLY6_9BACL|nr:LLM class flavin-dependent oxidoreductase [Seinonella peptonophila]SHE94426.1 luciferase family oxidoreductase, group 1 [Seinonella peptonophila]